MTSFVQAIAETAMATAVASDSESMWHTMLENPFQSLLAGLVVALLVYAFTSFNINIRRLDNRINRLEDSITADFTTQENRFNQRFAALENTFNQRFAAQENTFNQRFAAQDERLKKVEQQLETQDNKLDAINLSLTALVAHLGATAQVNIATGNRPLNALAAPTPNTEQPTSNQITQETPEQSPV